MEKIKLYISIILIVCIAKLPYEYYQFIRLLLMVGFGILAYESKLKRNVNSMFLYSLLAILFQPYFKITLRKENWNIIDLIIAIGLIVSIIPFNNFLKKRQTK